MSLIGVMLIIDMEMVEDEFNRVNDYLKLINVLKVVIFEVLFIVEEFL